MLLAVLMSYYPIGKAGAGQGGLDFPGVLCSSEHKKAVWSCWGTTKAWKVRRLKVGHCYPKDVYDYGLWHCKNVYIYFLSSPDGKQGVPRTENFWKNWDKAD